MSGNNNFFFVGPTAHGFENLNAVLSDTFQILPPIKRNDIIDLLTLAPPGIIVIVDGAFHAIPSVGHAEIREAIKQKWQVWGLSSLGAIRACEMRDFGMKGFGKVYERYVEEEDFQDDEVALLHGPLPPYPPCSEPLFHLRVALSELQASGFLTALKVEEITNHLKSLWYGKRTLSLFRSIVFESLLDGQKEAVEHFLNPFERFRTKNLDLQRFLAEKPWKDQTSC